MKIAFKIEIFSAMYSARRCFSSSFIPRGNIGTIGLSVISLSKFRLVHRLKFVCRLDEGKIKIVI